MHYKYEASSLLINFVTLIETQFHVRIKQIRLENAKELAIIDFSHSKGILRQFFYVERPEQNSIVERKHQHLLNVAGGLFFGLRSLSNFGVNVF